MAQKVHPRVAEKIRELVSEGITDTSSVSRMLRHYVNHHLCQEKKPKPSDRAYYPMKDDIKNHVYLAKQELQLSKLDQKNLELKLPKWKSEHPDSNIFRPFKLKEGTNEEKKHALKPGCYTGVSTTCETETAEDENNFEDTLLWIHQEKWQQELLTKYGNDISLIDATYKTTKYELPLFFLSVRTNVGYSSVAQFITQNETAQDIQEALEVLKTWNPSWKPNFFMLDYSEAEIAAIEGDFPGIQTYLCDFHREQCWERWVRDQKHELSPEDGEKLLELLRACAYAPPATEEGIPVNQLYKAAESALKGSDLFKENPHIRYWLLNMWLNKPQVCKYGCVFVYHNRKQLCGCNRHVVRLRRLVYYLYNFFFSYTALGPCLQGCNLPSCC